MKLNRKSHSRLHERLSCIFGDQNDFGCIPATAWPHGDHTFRGSSQRYARFSSPLQDMEIGRSALENALAIVRSVAWRDEIQTRFERLPSYFSTMIAFASISLIKAWGKEPTVCYLDKNDIFSALNRLVEVFDAFSAKVQPEHPLRSRARGLKVAINGSCSQAEGNQTDVGFMAYMIDSSLFAFDNIGISSFGFDNLDDHNNLMSSLRDFHSNFFWVPEPLNREKRKRGFD